MDLENFNKWPHFEAEDLEAVSEVLKSGKINRWTGDKNILFEDALGRASASRAAGWRPPFGGIPCWRCCRY